MGGRVTDVNVPLRDKSTSILVGLESKDQKPHPQPQLPYIAAEEALTRGIRERSGPFSLISNAGNKAGAFRRSGNQTCYPGLTTHKTREEIEGKDDSELREGTGEAE